VRRGVKRLAWVVLPVFAVLTFAQESGAQNPPTGTPAGQRGRGGGGGGRGRAIQVMTLTSSGFHDGGTIPVKYAQPGVEVSPPLSWSSVPDSNVVSFALVVHDLDAAGNNGDDLLHWLVWNIPATSRSLPEAVPQGPQLADGARQISASGPYYRGPAAPATGPIHHYVFELYALDATIDVPPVGAPPAATRNAVMTAMAGHVRGKAVLVGTFKRKS
jgi:Raf kinase inhibitor-like YbhB/YbcL family protein